MKKFLLSGVVLFFGILFSASAQHRVSGKITAAKDGTELPGVSVRIKDTTLGTASDVNGVFEMETRTDSDTLIFSFIGFQTQEVYVRQRTLINVKLEPETTELEEVV